MKQLFTYKTTHDAIFVKFVILKQPAQDKAYARYNLKNAAGSGELSCSLNSCHVQHINGKTNTKTHIQKTKQLNVN